MKVHELIAKLQALNPDAEVVYPDGEFGDLESFAHVGYNPENANEVVIDCSVYRWECDMPQPRRILNEAERRIQEMTTKAMSMWMTHFVDDLTKRAAYLDDLPKVSGPMRIRMPEVK